MSIATATSHLKERKPAMEDEASAGVANRSKITFIKICCINLTVTCRVQVRPNVVNLVGKYPFGVNNVAFLKFLSIWS